MFIGIYTRTDWKQSKQHSRRPCVYRQLGNGYVEVLPCSTAHQFSTDYIPLPLRQDIGLRKATQVLLDEKVRQQIPEVWIQQIGPCPIDIEEKILLWEQEHTVCNHMVG